MAVFVPVPNVVKAELIFSHSGQTAVNVLHYQAPGVPSAVNMEDLCEGLITWWDVNMQPLVASSTALTLVRATDLTTQFAQVVEEQQGLPLAGSAAGAVPPSSVTLCMTKRTALRGRSHRGRLYHVGFTSAQITGNSVVTATVNSLLSVYNMLLAISSVDGNYELVVVSYQENNQPLSPGQFTPVVRFTTDGIVDSQRRRLPGRGN